ncbi:MAG: DUF5615 family PIN-like protein [Phycisphaerales bacterium]
MKIKIDENLPGELVGTLRVLGHDTHTVRDEGLAGRDDRDIIEAALNEGRLLITQDLDFSDRRVINPREGIVIVRLLGCSRQRLAKRVAEVFEAADPADWRGCLVIVTAAKVRIRKQPPMI